MKTHLQLIHLHLLIDREDLDYGDKVILPNLVLRELTKKIINHHIYFKYKIKKKF